jgi:hypothetical protein
VTILLTALVIAVVMLAMAVGVVLRRPCLRGSCGGAELIGPDGEPLACSACPRRAASGTPSAVQGR